MKVKFSQFPLDLVALELVLILANLRASISWTLFPETSALTDAAWIEIGFWLIPVLLIALTLSRSGLLRIYLLEWRKNWLLLLFILFSLASIFWSISFSASLYRALTLVFASLAGAYLGIRYGNSGILKILFWFGAVVLILSVVLAFIFPSIATMVWTPYNGAWRGIYWHRNHLGSIAALLNAVYLIRAVSGIQKKQKEAILDVVMYLLSIAVIYLAASAAGYILIVLLHLAIALSFVWLKVAHALKPVHYYAFLIVFAIGLILVFANLEFVFSLVNRSPTMTGRTGLWVYLFQNVISQSPWFGYGFGAIWTFASFRTGTQELLGWGYPIAIADNGFIDILFHVGLLGLMLFMGVLILAVVRSFRYALAHRNLLDFFPLLLLFYSLVANISFSLFLETESFIWMLVISMLFLSAKKADTA